MKRLAIITTHPIQYYAPVFKLLAERKNIDIKVFYTLGNAAGMHDRGFQKTIDWDIPLLEGYDYEWAENTSLNPNTHNFKGIINPHLIKQIIAYQPDAVLVYGWANQAHFKVLRYFKGKIPVYFRGDSTLLNKAAGMKNLVRKIWLKWVYHYVDHAFYVGQNNKNYYLKYGLKADELSFAPHAIDNERFSVKRKDEAERLRQSLNLTDGDMLVLYAGKFELVKNVKLLLSAFRQLGKSRVHLLLTGNGEEESDLKEQAANATNIHFMDFKNQRFMPVLYQAADLFCLPSKSETWGLAVNEAMACGKAVLVSDRVGCAVDLVKPGINGSIFISNDPSSLLKELDKLTESRAQLNKLGSASKELIKDWNFTNIAVAIEQQLLNEAH